MHSFLRSCGRFASMLSACVVGLSLLWMPSSAAAEEDFTQLVVSGDWASGRICFNEGCLWIALVATSNLSDRVLSVVFLPDGQVHFRTLTSGLTQENIKTWGETTEEEVRQEFRVDKNPIIDATVTRTLDVEERTITEELPTELFGWDFVRQLRKGVTLRVRHHFSDEPFIERFSLKGAQKAIDRAYTMSQKEQNLRSPDERYFEDAPHASTFQRDSDFFQ